jgi:hypothetical protein
MYPGFYREIDRKHMSIAKIELWRFRHFSSSIIKTLEEVIYSMCIMQSINQYKTNDKRGFAFG